MTRETTKHSGRLDDELVHETADVTAGAPVPGRTRDDLRQEDPDELGAEAASSLDISSSTTARAELGRLLAGAQFPATTVELTRAADRNGPDEEFVGLLRRLPSDRRFATTEEVWEAIEGRLGPTEDPEHKHQDDHIFGKTAAARQERVERQLDGAGGDPSTVEEGAADSRTEPRASGRAERST